MTHIDMKEKNKGFCVYQQDKVVCNETSFESCERCIVRNDARYMFIKKVGVKNGR